MGHVEITAVVLQQLLIIFSTKVTQSVWNLLLIISWVPLLPWEILTLNTGQK